MFTIEFRGGLIRRKVKVQTVADEPGQWQVSATGCVPIRIAANSPTQALGKAMESIGQLQSEGFAVPAANGVDTAAASVTADDDETASEIRKSRRGKG